MVSNADFCAACSSLFQKMLMERSSSSVARKSWTATCKSGSLGSPVVATCQSGHMSGGTTWQSGLLFRLQECPHVRVVTLSGGSTWQSGLLFRSQECPHGRVVTCQQGPHGRVVSCSDLKSVHVSEWFPAFSWNGHMAEWPCSSVYHMAEWFPGL